MRISVFGACKRVKDNKNYMFRAFVEVEAYISLLDYKTIYPYAAMGFRIVG